MVRPRNSKSRIALARGIALLIGLVAGFLLLEVLLRIYNPFYVRIKGNRIVLVANRRITLTNRVDKKLDAVITITRNSLGFRGSDPPSQFSEDLTLITVGGSGTEDLRLSDDKTWTARLGHRLEGCFRNVWINNAGFGGHSTFGHIILLEDHIVRLHPKVVIFMVGVNDVAAARLNEFEVQDVKDGLAFNSFQAFIKSASAYSEVVALVANLRRSYKSYQAGLSNCEIDLLKAPHREFRPDEQQHIIDTYRGSVLQGYHDRLERLLDVCRKANIEPVFITQPVLFGPAIDDVTKVSLATIDLTPEIGWGANGEVWWEVEEEYNAVTRRVGQENNILVIDLARQFPKSSRYFYDFWHFTNEGAQAAANLISESLTPVLAEKYPEYLVPGCRAQAPISSGGSAKQQLDAAPVSTPTRPD